MNAIGTSTFSTSTVFGPNIETDYVDPNFTLASSTVHQYLGVNIFNTIQEAIDAVADSGYVNVASGTYSEHISLGRGVTLSGDTNAFSSGLENGGTYVIAPDCATLLTFHDLSFLEAIHFDSDDAGRHCTEPLAYVATSSVATMIGVLFDNANVGLEVGPSSAVVAIVPGFIRTTTGVRSDSPDSAVYNYGGYWGTPNGPTDPRNPLGDGATIDGVGSSTVFFQPFLLNDFFQNPNSLNLSSIPAITPDQIGTLFTNGGTFLASNLNNGPFPEFMPATSTTNLMVVEPVTINVPMDKGTTTVSIPGAPILIGPGFNLSAHDSAVFDATQITANVIDPNDASSTPSGPNIGTIIGKVLQFGIPGRQLDVSGNPISINQFVGNTYNGQTLGIYLAENLSGPWTQSGLVHGTCVVTDGYCDFETNTLSYFQITTIPGADAHWYANSTTGNDTTGDGSIGNPYKTFTKVYSQAADGNTIVLTGTFDWSNTAETGSVSGSGFTIDKDINITGQSATSTFVQASYTEDPDVSDRTVFTIAANKTVTISNVTIRNGFANATQTGGGITNHGILTLNNDRVENNGYVLNSDYYGAGGIFSTNASTLIISTSTIDNNVLHGVLYGAGGIYMDANNSSLTINASTINGNIAVSSNPSGYPYSYAEPAGAIASRAGQVKIINTTITNNTTNAYAGALNLWRDQGVTITNSTITGNFADQGGYGIVYGQDTSGHVMAIENSIIDYFYALDNTSAGYVQDNGHNIVVSSTNKIWNAVGDLTDMAALNNLDGTLADNGATNGVQTLALLAGSLAIDAGSTSTNNGVEIPSFDARGFYRNGLTDIGAFEYNGLVSIVATTSPATTTPATTTPPVTHPSSHIKSSGSYIRSPYVNLLLNINSATSTPVISLATSTYIYLKDLHLGLSGPDVTKLQEYLIQKNTGPAASALAKHGTTNYFGKLTQAALIEFQKAVDISPAIGYFGPKTRAYVNSH